MARPKLWNTAFALGMSLLVFGATWSEGCSRARRRRDACTIPGGTAAAAAVVSPVAAAMFVSLDRVRPYLLVRELPTVPVKP